MPASKQRSRVLIERNADVAEFGEKDQHGAYETPLKIAGESVDLDSLPALSDVDKPAKGASE